jgi:uncharacterized sulfatase
VTGQQFWRLEQGANMRSFLPAKFPVYPDLLEAAGYHVGFTGKGHGPADLRDRKRNPAGPSYPDFAQFLKARPAGAPFCYWFGSTHPHRPYPAGSWRERKGWSLDDAVVPPFLPDAAVVRGDLLDYYRQIEIFDAQLNDLLGILDRSGERDNTLLVVTSDNGMPFPRCKTYLYDWGTRMPLAVRWPAQARGGRVVDDFIGFHDFAPTFLAAAGLKPGLQMTGRSFLDVVCSGKSGYVDRTRKFAVTGRERHSPSRPDALGYPCRALRDERYLYIRNFAPERWPAGDPPATSDVDPSPTADFLAANPSRYSEWAYAKRPAEELYDVKKDPAQIRNVAQESRYAGILRKLRSQLVDYLHKTRDPRVIGGGEEFDRYPFTGPPRYQAEGLIPAHQRVDELP